MTGKHDRLLGPGRIGGIEIRNRIVMPAMDQNLCDGQGLVTDDLIEHYRSRAAGGVGLLILETSAVAYPVGATSRHQPALSTDDCIPGLARLAEAVHAEGARMFVQICHHGKVARIDTLEGRDLLVASVPLPHPRPELTDITPDELARIMAVNGGRRPTEREATPAELEEVAAAFAAAAVRVKAAGLDGVEIHGGHGYLISGFLSPLYNRRDDDYGGSPENRARLLVQVVKAVREAAGGPDFAVTVRLDGCEFGGGGIDVSMAATYAAAAEAAGVDAVHVSASSTNSMGPGFTDGPLPWRPGQYVELARLVKGSVRVPVIAVGRISPDQAETLLERGDTCDFVSMGRQLLADPEIPARLQAGRPDLVRTCISCFVCVAQNFWDGTPVCAINTRLGHYSSPAPTQAATARRVLVVGGGPAGLEAARVAAHRGHRVLLLERHRLGGTARLSALTTPANAELVRYLTAAVADAGVEVRVGVTADVDGVRAERPDVVVVATGARRSRPALPGGDGSNVLSGDDLRAMLTGSGTARSTGPLLTRLAVGAAGRLGLLDDIGRLRDLSRRWLPLGQNLVVVGGGLVGMELAEFLAERGRRVTLLSEEAQLGAEMALPRRWRAVEQLGARGVEVIRQVEILGYSAEGVTVRRAGADGTELVRADQIIYAGGVTPDTTLTDQLRQAGLDVRPAGDCATVGYIQGAIHSGAAAAASI